MRRLMADVGRGAFTYAAPTLDLLHRAMQIEPAHAAPELGLVDASLVALAEHLGVRRVATRDVRDFAAVRLRGGRAMDLVVVPRHPDPGRR